MKVLIVLMFIANAEKPVVVDIYNPTAGAYGICKAKAKELNATNPNGYWNCSLRHRKDLL